MAFRVVEGHDPQSPERDRGPKEVSMPGKEWIINNITTDDPTNKDDSPERFWQKALAASGRLRTLYSRAHLQRFSTGK